MTQPSAPRHTRRGLAHSMRLATLGLLVLATGCGKEGEASEPAQAPGRVALAPREATPLESTLEVVGVVKLPTDPEQWEVEGARRQQLYATRGDQPAGLMVSGSQEMSIRVPLDPKTPPFNIVAVEITCPTQATLHVLLTMENGNRLGSSGVWVRGTGTPQIVLFEMPQTRQLKGPFDALHIGYRSKGTVVALHRVELLQRPVATFLPDAAVGAKPVELGMDDSRLAVGLSSERPIGALIDVPKDGVLRFAYGLTQHLRAPGGAPSGLRVTVTSEGKNRLERTVPLVWGALTGRWTEMEVPLADFGGRRARVKLELETRAPEEILLAIAEARVVVPMQSPPTVLLVTSDTHRFDHVSASNSGVDVRTSNIDALADRGVFFTNCFTSANSTNPSHVALLTGRHPRDTGVFDNNTPIAEEAPTLAARFASAGFRTVAALSARHLGHDTSGLGMGFDRMKRPLLAQHVSAQTIDGLLGWTDDLADEPLFVWLHVFDAHTPYEPPADYLARHWPMDRNPFDRRLPEPEGLPQSIFGDGGRYEGLRDLEFPRAKYRAEVDSLDAQLARVFDHPRLGGGVVAFTADHGELLGHHDCYYDHAGVYPDSIHVPLAFAWPGAPGGLRIDRPVSHLDIGRTLLDLAELADVPFPGADLTAPLRGEPEPPAGPRYALAAHGLATAITVGDWHLVLHIVDNAPHHEPGLPVNEAHKVELYHLGRDPGCLDDLVEEHFDVALRLREQLLRWLTNPEPTGWARAGRLDDSTVQQLAELGYTAGALGQAPKGLRWEPDSCEWCRRFE